MSDPLVICQIAVEPALFDGPPDAVMAAISAEFESARKNTLEWYVTELRKGHDGR